MNVAGPHRKLANAAIIAWLGCLAGQTGQTLAAPPDGFAVEQSGPNWGQSVGAVPVGDGRLICWRRDGIAQVLQPNGSWADEPMFDISEEVGSWRDHGLLGLALDPEFDDTGYVYLLYVVDRHHLLFHGTEKYDSKIDWEFEATIGRVTRYTADLMSDSLQVDPASRTILLGSSITNGIPIVHQSHGVGSLVFGTDGSLLISVGDSASYIEVDTGGQVGGGYVDQAMEDGILRKKENVGAFRSQLIDSHCGKVLRLDPQTGEGLPSNPYFRDDAPSSPASRTWCLGLRNPFRMSIVPGTGSTDPADGDPGTLLIADVGWNLWEELNFVAGSGTNLGWPMYEGLRPAPGYPDALVENPDAPNPLARDRSCSQSLFHFQDLLVPDSPGNDSLHPNPCATLEFQAEDAHFAGPIFQNGASGYTGSGFIDYQNPFGDFVRFSVTMDEPAEVTIKVRYALNSTNRPLRLYVNGSGLGLMQFPGTGAWDSWKSSPAIISLEEGVNEIMLQADGLSGPNIDRMDVFINDTTIMNVPTFEHARPMIAWYHSQQITLVPGWDEWLPITHGLGEPDCPVEGEPFIGACAAGGTFHQTSAWPAEYSGDYYIADLTGSWIRRLQLDGSGGLEAVHAFDSASGPTTQLFSDPVSGNLVQVRWNKAPFTYRYTKAIPCTGDLDGDGLVDGVDLAILLAQWLDIGTGDLNEDGIVNGRDLAILLGGWGDCN